MAKKEWTIQVKLFDTKQLKYKHHSKITAIYPTLDLHDLKFKVERIASYSALKLVVLWCSNA